MQPLLIRIEQQYAIVGLHTTRPRMSIRQPKGQLEIRRIPLDLGIHSEHPLVQIDQSRCFEEAGRKGIFALIADLKQYAYNQVMAAIAETAAEGDRLAAIQNGGNPIADIAFEKGLEEEHYFNVVSMPRSRPGIDFKGGKVTYNVTGGKVEIRFTPRKPAVDVALGDVEVGYSQEPYIKIDYVGHQLDSRI